MNVTVVIPCYNEEASLPTLFRRLDSLMADRSGWEVILVDDGSTDQTPGLLAIETTKRVWARVETHASNRGVGAAMRTGFARARGALVCTADCDCTYPVERLPELIDALGTAGIVTASPWHPSLSNEDVPWLRQVLSRGVSKLYRAVLGQPVYTFSSIFRVYRRSVIEQTPFDSNGFAAVTEILVKALLRGVPVVEVPMAVGTRVHGESKMSIPRAIGGHLDLLGKTLRWRMQG